MPGNPSDAPKLPALELERIVSEEEAARLRGVSPDTLKRLALQTGKPRRRQLSPRRVGYRLGDVLEI
jgi:predicted DNA-binding transcriptional regulator AlpA